MNAIPNRKTLPREDVADILRAGTSEIAVTIDETGRVIDAHMTQLSGSRIYDEMNLESARSPTYRPETVDGFRRPDTIHVRLQPPRVAP